MSQVQPTLKALPVPTDSQVLAALSACLTDLAALRDRRLVIQAIVKRTRALCGADLAYVSLNDLAAGETYIKFTDGVRTQAYETLRMPLGAGVLGAVASGGETVQTQGYVGDPELNHLQRIDDIVAGEGVHSIMGTPMRVGGRVIGALMLAHRSPVRFAKETIRAMNLLGQHAAIALEHTRLHTEVMELANTTEARELKELLSIDDRLLGALSFDEGLEAITAVLTEATSLDAFICSPSGQWLAGKELPQGLNVGDENVDAFITSSFHGANATVHQFNGSDVAISAVAARGEHLGTIILFGGSVSPPHLRVLERAAVYVSTLLSFERSLAEAGLREQGVLFDDLLVGETVSSFASRLSAFGLTRPSSCHVSIFRLRPEHRYQAIEVIRQAFGDRAIVTQHGGEICFLAEGDPQLAHEALRRVNIVSNVGVVDIAEHWSEVPAAHQRAHQIVSALNTLGRFDTLARLPDLGLAGLLISGVDTSLVSQLITRHLGPLIEYDTTRGTDLRHTALVFLETASMSECAEVLHLHPNTVRQRIERIDSLLGPWREGPKRADYHLILRLAQLAKL
ncbi:MAG: GAF domain-containing protein [Actinomycetaceae bacterium]|nr:GAF domain-containing protein [Actinomycetaceae bacterium]